MAAPKPKQENLSLLLALLAYEKLPTPDMHVRFAKPRRWAVDLMWPAPLMVVCEVEGGVWVQGRHTRGSGFIGDIEKYNELAIRGYLLVRVTYAMIADGRAVEVIRRALAARSGGTQKHEKAA